MGLVTSPPERDGNEQIAERTNGQRRRAGIVHSGGRSSTLPSLCLAGGVVVPVGVAPS